MAYGSRGIADAAVALHVPHLLDVEVAQVLRRYVRDAELHPDEAAEAILDLRDLGAPRRRARAASIERWSMTAREGEPVSGRPGRRARRGWS